MHGQVQLMCARANLFGACAREECAAREVVRVLKRDEAGRRDVVGAVDVKRGGDLIPRQDAAAVSAFDGARDRPRYGRHRRHLEVEDVPALFDDHFHARPRVQLDGDLITHRAGRDKDGCFLLEDFGRALLQAIHGRVFAIDIIAHLCTRHRAPHRGRRLCHCVAA